MKRDFRLAEELSVILDISLNHWQLLTVWMQQEASIDNIYRLDGVVSFIWTYSRIYSGDYNGRS